MRPGGVLPWVVIALPGIVACLVLAVQVSCMNQRQAELANCADASAHAAACALLDDLLFTDLPDRYERVAQRARLAALGYGDANRYWGQPFSLDPNQVNDPDGEVVVGTIEGPDSKDFDITTTYQGEQLRPHLNAVRVAVGRDGTTACSTAYVDRDVVGFRADSGCAMPIVPLAILTDPAAAGAGGMAAWLQCDRNSWEYQVLARQGTDALSFDPATGTPQHGGDHIPEMKVILGAGQSQGNVNGRVALLGDNSTDAICRQIGLGVTAEDLALRGGQLALDPGPASGRWHNLLNLPDAPLSPDALEKLAHALQSIVGQKRVWLLYDKPLKSAAGRLEVSGFVAARVLSVQAGQHIVGTGAQTTVTIILQPCSMAMPCALTDRKRRDTGIRTLHNPCIGKVRFVE
jgi:hypothetical protein